MNRITSTTTKEQVREVYKEYPDTQPNGFEPFHASRVDPIYWDIPDGATVLDVGCNSGAFLRRLAEGKRGITAKGVDVSEKVVALAKEKGLDVSLGDGESLPFPDASFDYVVLMEVLVHVHEPLKMLKEIRRVLKKDGVLLGSCPHKNLEMNIWDDRRLHHAYYKTEEVYGLMREVFDSCHLKILKGGQFSMGMAGSYLGDKDVEILFKCGSSDMKGWDWKLKLDDTLRVWMGPTFNPGVAYYRMTGFAGKMNKIDRTDILYHGFSASNENGPGEWQDALHRTEGNRPANSVVLDQLDGLLKIADLSVWQITPYWGVLAFLECLKEVYRKPVITEMDDWIFDVPSYNIASHPYQPNSDREKVALRQIEISDALIVSTNFIAESIRALFPGKPVYVVRNGIDFDLWDSAKAGPTVKKQDGRIRIGYTGCGNHGGDLEHIKRPLLAILDEFPNVEFVTSGAMRRGRKDAPVVIEHERSYVLNQWASIDDWPSAVKGWQMDIGIAPLLDVTFNRAKSNLRWLEYSALGIPTVASNVRPFRDSIEDGKDGFVCASRKAWYETLRGLIIDAGKRRSVGAAAYKRVKAGFNMDDVAKSYRSILEVIKRESGRNTR